MFSSRAIHGNMLGRFHAGNKYTVLAVCLMRLSTTPPSSPRVRCGLSFAVFLTTWSDGEGRDVRGGVGHGPGGGDCNQEGTQQPADVNRTLHLETVSIPHHEAQCSVPHTRWREKLDFSYRCFTFRFGVSARNVVSALYEALAG